MGSDVAEVLLVLQNPSGVKAHSCMCWELIKILEKVVYALPAIEAARPGGRSGIQELCSLTNAMEKAKLLLQHCAESSKLYLAITGDSILLRCERIRSALNGNLSQIQDMVPVPLAAQITEILDYLRGVKFTIDPAEGEAGKAMLELLGQTVSTTESELEAFKIAASRLNLTSSKALLIERRSVKKLLDEVSGTDPKKERILSYLLCLIKKHGKQVRTDTTEKKENANPQSECLMSNTASACDADYSDINNKLPDRVEAHTALCETDAPPDEFRCPISSKLMYDPVVIASGQTFERICIEKWFSEGHDTCPKTHKKLTDLSLVPNSCMRDLISNWCRKHGVSIEDPCLQIKPASFSSWEASHNSISSLKNVSARLLDGSRGDYILQSDYSNVSFASSDGCYSDSSLVKGIDSLSRGFSQMCSWSDDYQKGHTFSGFSQDMYLKFFHQLSQLQLDAQGKAIEELKILMKDDETCHVMVSNGLIEALMSFLKNAYSLSDGQAQKIGVQILLAFLRYNRVEIQAIDEDAFQLLASLLESEIAIEALMIMQVLFHHPNFISLMVAFNVLPSIVKFLDDEVTESLEVAVQILCDMSSHCEIKPHIISSGCISKLSPLLGDRRLAENCIRIIRNLCDVEEAGVEIAKTNGCLASIAELLDVGSREEQEHAAVILHSLCSQSFGNCKLVMNEGVIPSLVSISINGSPKGRESSMKLLHILRDLRNNDSLGSSESEPESNDCFESSESQSKSQDCFESSLSLAESKSKLVEDCVNHSTKRQSSKSTGFWGRKMKFFLKPRSLVLTPGINSHVQTSLMS